MTRLQARSIVLVVLVAASLGLVALNQTGQLALVKSVLGVPLAAVQRGVSAVTSSVAGVFQRNPDADALAARNAELEAQVAELQNRIVGYQENETELRILSALLDYARTAPQHEYAAANVIGRDTSAFRSFIFLDIGSDAGVRRDMPVVTNQGLVGLVVETTCCSSKIRLITDPESAINARLQASRDEGVVVGRQGGGLELQYLSQQAEIHPGDVVLTSALSGRVPAGIVLGTISAVQRLDYEVLQTAVVTPGVDFSRLEIVLVITNFQPVDLGPLDEGPLTAP
jgi:rod shape-determining protein MreC